MSKFWEQEVLESANIVTAVTRSIIDQFLSHSNCNITSPMITLSNGFDPNDFSLKNIRYSKGDKFRIVYTGSLYGIRKADTFLSSIEYIIQSGKLCSDNLKVEFIGKDGTGTLISHAHKSWFNHRPQISHDEAIASMIKADILLLLVPPEGYYITSSKLYEYLKASRPILALAPLNSEAARVIRETNHGVVVPPRNIEKIAAAILWYYKTWQSGELEITPNHDVISSYDRRRLTEKLATVLERSLKIS